MISFYVTLLVAILGSVFLVWAGATLYFRYRQAQFWDRAEALAAEPMTDDERAAFAEWDQACAADGLDEEPDFLDQLYDELEPEGDPKAAPAMTAQEALQDIKVAAKAKLDRERRHEEDEPPIGVVFDGGDGNKYKYVINPRTKARVRMKVSGAVGNAAALPTPTPAEMSRLMARSAAETVYGMDPAFDLDVTDEACELCNSSESHSHTGAELRYFIDTRVEESFKKQIEDMDLTKLTTDEVERLWARCRARIEQNATLVAMSRLDKLWYRVTQFDEDDEAFFQQTCAEAAQGPVPLELMECVMAPQAEEKRGNTCANCEDLPGAGPLKNPCDCTMCIKEQLKEGETMLFVEQAKEPVDEFFERMNKEEPFSDQSDHVDQPASLSQKASVDNKEKLVAGRFLSGIMRQTAENSLIPSLELLAADVYEDGTPEIVKNYLTKAEEREHRGAIGRALGSLIGWYQDGKPKSPVIVEGPIDKIRLIPAKKKAPKKVAVKAKTKARKKK
jgi:hypothetical protein